MSEKTSPTPGPWTFSRWDEHGYTRFYIAQQEGAPYTPDYSDVASCVAETVSGERVEIQEANARLLSAAPDLLEALKDLYDYVGDSVGFAGSADSVFEKAQAALEKATGEKA